ncbi:MAG: acetate--CoA ligase alpha subunit [Promethearchaeota archaeon]
MATTLDVFFNPHSIAVIGASATQGKVGHSVLQNILQSGYAGEVYPINIREPEILGHKAYKSVLVVPGKVELAVICIPSRFAVSAVEECGKKGVKGVVIITAGFKEVGGEGAVRENQIVELGKKYGMRILGPNCLGIISLAMNASFASQHPPKGDIAIMSQSGAMLTGILDWSMGNNIGFSSFISLGNKCDIDEVDLFEYLAQDPNTKIILAYLEDIHDGAKFFRVLEACGRRKPIIILKSGRSEAGAQAASSHTGSLAGSDIAYTLAFEKVGVTRAITISELFDYALVFRSQPVPKGDKFAVITNAGGPGIIATDAFSDNDLGFARFSQGCIEKLLEGLPEEANVYDPVDIIGDAPPERYKFAIETIFQEEDEVCAGALVILTPQAQTNPPKVSSVMIEIAKRYPGKILIGAYIGGAQLREPKVELIRNGIPCFDFPEQGIQALKALERFGAFQRGDVCSDIERIDVNAEKVLEIIRGVRADGRTVLLNYETSAIFEEFRITHPKSKLATSAAQAADFAEEMGFPVVMKIVSPQIIHKSDVGGVILPISSREEVVKAYVDIISNVKRLGPSDAKIYGVEVQEMIDIKSMKKSTELIIGVSRDPQFGPLIMFGLGGIFVNFLKDVAFGLTYRFTRDDAKRIMHSTKAFSLLQGVRGEPPSDIRGIEKVLMMIAQLVNEFHDIVELDINPLIAFAEDDKPSYSAVDIKITIKP